MSDDESPAHTVLIRWIRRIVLLAVVILVGVWSTYAFVFWKHPVSLEAAEWGQFGDFVGGAVNPLLAFLTLVILALTIVLQSKQLLLSGKELALSRKELELTREELRRSAHAQEQAERALKKQAAIASQSARMSAANFLLENYRLELKAMRGEALMSSDPRLTRMKELERRQAGLVAVLDALYEDIISGANSNDSVQDR